MKRSEVEAELKRLKDAMFYMKCNNTGREEYRSEIQTRIEIYQRLLLEGYDKNG